MGCAVAHPFASVMIADSARGVAHAPHEIRDATRSGMAGNVCCWLVSRSGGDRWAVFYLGEVRMSHFLHFGYCANCELTRSLNQQGRCFNCDSDAIEIRKPHSPDKSVIDELMELEKMFRVKP